jgi:Tfp pilus assembly protein FimT
VVSNRTYTYGFTMLELVVMLGVAAILFMAVIPTIQSSISEHRTLNFLATLKADLEWARNHALSNNTKVRLVFKTAPSPQCLWTTETYQAVTNTYTALPNHKMTAAELEHYGDMVCNYTGSTPTFNGMGLSNAAFTVGLSTPGTVRRWQLALDIAGDVNVVAQ